MTLVIPPGKKTGCLPRASKVGQWCSLLADHVRVIPEGEWPELIDTVPSLSDHCPITLDQDGVGSCATESTSMGVMVSRSWQGQRYELLNPWSVYYYTSGGRDQGSNIDTNLAHARDKGICPESIWPRSKGWRTRPSAEAMEAAKSYRISEFYDITSTQEIGTALLLGFAVVMGWSGHSVIMTELLDTRTARYKNSWGQGWGDDGFGTLALSKVNFGYGAFAIRSTTADHLEKAA